MPLSASAIENLLRRDFSTAIIQLTDLVGDEDHWEVTITAEAFRGKTRIEQHKMVFDALGEVVGRELHAIRVKTKTPE